MRLERAVVAETRRYRGGSASPEMTPVVAACRLRTLDAADTAASTENVDSTR